MEGELTYKGEEEKEANKMRNKEKMPPTVCQIQTALFFIAAEINVIKRDFKRIHLTA